MKNTLKSLQMGSLASLIKLLQTSHPGVLAEVISVAEEETLVDTQEWVREYLVELLSLPQQIADIAYEQGQNDHRKTYEHHTHLMANGVERFAARLAHNKVWKIHGAQSFPALEVWISAEGEAITEPEERNYMSDMQAIYGLSLLERDEVEPVLTFSQGYKKDQERAVGMLPLHVCLARIKRRNSLSFGEIIIGTLPLLGSVAEFADLLYEHGVRDSFLLDLVTELSRSEIKPEDSPNAKYEIGLFG